MPEHFGVNAESSGALHLGQIASPGAPVSGARLYSKADGKFYAINTGGVETSVLDLGGGSAIYGDLSLNTGTVGALPYVIPLSVAGSVTGMTVVGNKLQVDTAGVYLVTGQISMAEFNAASNWVSEVQIRRDVGGAPLAVSRGQHGASVNEDAGEIGYAMMYQGGLNVGDQLHLQVFLFAGSVGSSPTFKDARLNAVKIG